MRIRRAKIVAKTGSPRIERAMKDEEKNLRAQLKIVCPKSCGKTARRIK